MGIVRAWYAFMDRAGPSAPQAHTVFDFDQNAPIAEIGTGAR